jgi:molecular chaperone HtpG
MKIKIPKKFNKKLSGDYSSYIQNSISDFSAIYNDNKLEFFPEFTDHGIEHIEDVLITASNLISDETYEFLTEKDIAVLIMSVILHDFGMHISSEGIKKIFSTEYDEFRIASFDTKTWKEEWEEFLYEAKRFNDEQLINIFGTSKIEIEDPDINNLNDQSRKIYGEFIRRNHHRLAHEIAIGGFPTKIGTQNIKTTSKLDNEIIDLCGLVARSHGMNLRDTFEYLEENYDQLWKNPYDIKVVFLMINLRISDYIQIQSGRADDVLVKTKRFSSPFSKKEWKKHSSIKHISINTDDPERIYVTAKPENSVIFLELKKLFNDIQYEFDLSWAILGEVYGKDANLSRLKIKFRRITSNLDNIKKFTQKVNYVPEKIKFDADSELLKLLIGPLYGEDPKYGIRELLQNSVDAVKERAFIDSNSKENITISINNIEAEENKYYLKISDNGIGMSKDTIINFFFRAGASFRNSMLWKKKFIEKSEVKVEKTGRFGVGVLAAFLLGNEFELFTRNHLENKGYTCKASLETEQIELLKCDCEIGTSIKVILSDNINELFNNLINGLVNDGDRYYEKKVKLDWFNWYLMETPKIEFNFSDIKLKQIFNFNKKLISSDIQLPSKGWYNFKTNDFKGIHWTINVANRRHDYFNKNNNKTDLICNGFKINRAYILPNFPWKLPMVSVFDGNARMPLSLSRDYLLNDRLPFESELIENVCNKIIDLLLKTEFYKKGKYWIVKDNILHLEGGNINLRDYIVIKEDEFTLKLPFIFKELKVNVFYQLWLKNEISNNSFLF